MDDPSLLLILSNLLHLHTYLHDSSLFLPDSAAPSSAALHSSAAAPLLFFAIASALSYASSSLSSGTSDPDCPSPSPPPSPPPLPAPRSSLSSSSFFLSADQILSMEPVARDAHFRSLYGVSHPIFDTLLKNLRRLNAAAALGPNGLPLEHALAVALARLAHGASARSLARSLNIPPAVVSRATNALTRLLATRLYRRYVILPIAADQLLSTIQSFRDITGLPNVAGAIASSPVRLKRRRRLSLNDGSLRGGVGGDNLGEDDEDLLLRSPNRGYPSILLQVVADHRKVFWDACVRAPGSSDPSFHLRDSLLYHSLLSSDKDGGGLLQEPVVSVHGHQVHPCLIGDASYPLLPCLLTPFSPGMSPSSSSVTAISPEEAFDAALAKGRAASVEAALALLKGRWKILRNLNVGLDHAAQTVVACVVLHNMRQFAKEPEEERRFMWLDPPERPQLARPVENEQQLHRAGESLRMSLAEELFQRQQKLSGQR